MVSRKQSTGASDNVEDLVQAIRELGVEEVGRSFAKFFSESVQHRANEKTGSVAVLPAEVKLEASSDDRGFDATGSAAGGGTVRSSIRPTSCFGKACRVAGFDSYDNIHSVDELNDKDVVALGSMRDYKVVLTVYGVDDTRNHIELSHAGTKTAVIDVVPVGGARQSDAYTFVTTTMQHFFNKSNAWAKHKFYSDNEGFGGAIDRGSGARNTAPRPASVTAESVHGGSSNVSSGVQRSRRRVIASKSNALGGPVSKNYRASNAVMFNNADELFQDKISREYAQEIIEELFEVWGVPVDQPEAAKYAEDLLWTFLIAVTASNKADYNRVYDIPVKPVTRDGVSVSVVDGDFAKFSVLLESKFGVTRRQFARGVADDLRAFLKMEENQSLLPPMATRVGCEPLMAYLAFDGSTHCSNMTTREVTFTKTLESRNLFERDDVVAQGSSDKLMQGMSGGVRSVSSR